MTASTKAPNRLIEEKSPYLLQHAHNPVDWWPWCDEAFAKAKRENKPVFLSVGYSTCHWCHVMAHESFEDETVAALLNAHFVSIKVDREVRPDVDHVYMTACTAMTGSGGWPLSAFLTPEREPFFAGTYFPKNDAYGRMGFISLLKQIASAWRTDNRRLFCSASQIIGAIHEKTGMTAVLDTELIRKVTEAFMRSYDREWGGFGRAPKFPSPHNLMFLMRAAYSEPADSDVWSAVGHTLSAMAAGGLRDHIGGGFSRYSTDARWLVPHFEKMLYDNALLLMAYTEYYQKTGEFADVIGEIIEYLLRDMASSGLPGCFCAAQDADSEGEEGKFYCFTPDQIRDALGSRDGQRFCDLYGITDSGSFEGRSIPNLIGKTLTDDDRAFAARVIPALRDIRSRRVPPHRDDKVMLTGNALLCAALAKAGRALDDAGYALLARGCADALLENLVSGDMLYAVQGISCAATLDGYAYLVWALLEVYESVFDRRYLSDAVKIHEMMSSRFSGEGGILYYSDQDDLPVRGVNAYDGAVPSGQSVAVHNSVRLSRLTGDFGQEERGKLWAGALSGMVSQAPQAHAWMLAAILHMEHGGADVALVRGTALEGMLSALRGFQPFVTVTLQEPDASRPALNNSATAYVCTGGACMPPVSDATVLARALK